MRKMKRALSLALAMIMLLGMVMVPAGAADTTFVDADLIENTEAVQITSGIGLFAGTTDGRFAPKATVTRAQMATIIVKMLRGSDFNADAFKGVGVNPFPDTADFEGGWAEGYINACSQLGVVAGYGDGTFKPGRELTTAEALTMILNALGVEVPEGEWPSNYLIKAEEMKLYGDLETRPAADEPLNRDQLAVIVWEGLQYSPNNQTGWRCSDPDVDIVFENFTDAVKANGGSAAGVTAAVGEDSLANKVFELKTASGWITENQASGQKYTQLCDANGSVGKFDVETGVDMLGHYVTVYYKETYSTEKAPGLTYTVVDESTVVTVKEAISSSKNYKAAFGSHSSASSVMLFDHEYDCNYVDVDKKVPTFGTISGYTAGSAAPTGTYILADGVVVSYIAPVTVTAAYVVDISTVDGEETIWVSGANGDVAIPNSADDDQIVEYDGIADGDFVTYRMVRGVCVLSPVTRVTGTVTRTFTGEEYGVSYDALTLDGTDYLAFGGPSSLSGKLDTGLLSADGIGQNYALYLAEDGHYIGFEELSSGLSVSNAVFLLGNVIVKEKDQYGVTTWCNMGRGIDLEGTETMVLIGKVKDNGDGTYSAADDTTGLLGTMNSVQKAFYTVEEHDQSEARKEEIKQLLLFPSAYSPDTPTYALKPSTTTSTIGSSTNITTMEGITATMQSDTRFLVLDGDVTDDEALTATSGIPVGFSLSSLSTANYCYMLVTRSGTRSLINVFVYHGSDAVQGEIKYLRLTQEQIDTKGQTVDGDVWTAYNAETGAEDELVIDPSSGVVGPTTPGMYKAVIDENDEVTSLESVADVTGKPNFDDGVPQVYANVGWWGQIGSSLRGSRMASETGAGDAWLMSNGIAKVTSAVVIDLRTEAEIKASGVPELKSVSQITSLREADPGLMVAFDYYLDDPTSGSQGTVRTIFVSHAARMTIGMNSIVYVSSFDGNGMPENVFMVRGITGNLGDQMGTERLGAEKIEVFKNGGAGFYRYCVDADGKLRLAPFDADTVWTGAYGMAAMHETISAETEIDSGTLELTTVDSGCSSCGFACTNATVEPLKTFTITEGGTLIMDGASGAEISFAEFSTRCRNSTMSIDYYCDSPVAGTSASASKDGTAELIVVTGYSSISGGTYAEDITADVISDGTFSGKVTANMITGGTFLAGHALGGSPVITGGTFYGATTADLSGFLGAGAQMDIGADYIRVWTPPYSSLGSGDQPCNDASEYHKVAISAGGDYGTKVNYYLDADLTTGITISGSDEATLCLNGHSITTTDGTAAITVSSGATLHLCNCGSGGKLTGGAGAALLVSGTAYMYDGVSIDGGTYSTGISPVMVNGTFTMNGGTISNNTVSGGGGGVRVTGTFTMNGGTITGNTDTNNSNTTGFGGGGVYLSGSGQFTMNAGTITNNAAYYRGGGIYAHGASTKVTIAGGTISYNKDYDDTLSDLTKNTSGGGGGVCVNNGTLEMTGGTIEYNEAYKTNSGGGIAVIGSAKGDISGGIVRYNKVVNHTYGGGLNIGASASATISGSFQSYGNTDKNSSSKGVCKLASKGGLTIAGGFFQDGLTLAGPTTVSGGEFTTTAMKQATMNGKLASGYVTTTEGVTDGYNYKVVSSS